MAQQGGDLIEDDDEDFCITESGSSEDALFDDIVGALQNILLDESFVNLQTSFCERNCDEFDDTDENKLSYTGIFEEYCSVIEAFLEENVKREIKEFSLSSFGKLVASRKDEICGDVFDLLLSLGDFAEFKDLMLDHKRTKARRNGPRGDLDLIMQRPLNVNTAAESPVSNLSTRCESKLDLSP
mmetsp:Transcript_22040/g.26029  ORF Transcript_22040/g.26029 Transcript_22040/m.26029 type:complete len:184 (-) Transcript_22040:92-643(-)